jgi:transmembrane sensor
VHADVAAAVAWTDRLIVFEGTPLTQVVEEFNRYTRRQLVIRDASLETFHISGVYSSSDPASLVRFLRAQDGIDVVETDTEIRISAK